MKKATLFFLFVILQSIAQAQTNSRIAMSPWFDDANTPKEAQSYLKNKLQNLIISANYISNSTIERFVLAVRIDVVQKDVTPTAPIKVVNKLNITLYVGDVLENKLFASMQHQTVGIGNNETQSFINALNKLDGKKESIIKMLSEAQTKILDYYTLHCDDMVTHARQLAAREQFDEALAILTSVPNINSECFALCQQQATDVYNKKINAEAAVLLNSAKSAWLAHPDKKGAEEVAKVLEKINPSTKSYNEANNLRNEIASKLKADDRKVWEYKMKQLSDSHDRQIKAIDAARDVALAWVNRRPNSVYKTIIYGW